MKRWKAGNGPRCISGPRSYGANGSNGVKPAQIGGQNQWV